MYAAYFGLTENPFNLTPDQRYLFLSHYHNEALHHVLYGINTRKGFVTVIGGVGTGKTTLCRALLNQLDASTKTALIFNTAISDVEFLETINQEFGIETGGTKKTRKEHIDLLNAFLLDNFKQGGNAVVVVDEAQNLSPLVLEQIRMLSNLETEREKLIQIVLVGQPELRKHLLAPALRQLNERITVRYQLRALDRQDVKNYIEHRLVIAGGRGNVRFSTGALSAIYAYSRGNPRRINAVCDRALLIGYSKDEFKISRDTILRGVDDIKGNFKDYDTGTRWFQNRLAPAAAVMLMVFIVANLGGWNFRDQLSGLFSAVEKVAVVQGKTFIRRPVQFEKTAVVENRPFVVKPIKAQKKATRLVLDERTSLARLFRLFNIQEAETSFATGEVYPSLFSFEGDPELYRMITRPFRLRIRTDSADEAGYLLIREVTTGGAIALDAEDNERPVTEDFILAHWDGEMSWVYPYEHLSGKLTEGMSGLRVLKVQQMLQYMGYSVEPRGVYDRTTFEEVTRFQLNFGLKANGIVDTQTKALLYQMSG
jgi:general secretion pathway protein A